MPIIIKIGQCLTELFKK